MDKMTRKEIITVAALMGRFGGLPTRDGSAPFESTDLSDADLSNTDLSDTNLSNTNLSNADLSNADLSDTNLSNTNLSNADLSWADLTWTNLSNTDLSGTNLSNADLSWADLSNTNLSNANLKNADLSNAELSWSNVIGTGILCIYVPGMSSRLDALYARRESDGVWFWVGCQRRVTAQVLRDRLKDPDEDTSNNKPDAAKAQYLAAIDFALAMLELADGFK